MAATIAEIHETLDRIARRDEELRALLAESARRDEESIRRDEERKAESARRDEERKAESARRDAEYKAAAEQRDAEYKAERAARDRRMEAESKKTDKAMRKLEHLFHDQWSRLVEALVNNQVVPLLKSRGIPVASTLEREKGRVGDRHFEFDIIAKNGDAIVAIEVKTTLRPDDVKEFLDELAHIKEWLPMYAHLTVYGAVAFLHAVAESDNFAQKKGLFTILATGDGATITNSESFAPKEW